MPLLDLWFAGVESLPDDRLPCPGMIWREYGAGGRDGVWPAVREAMLRFVRDWGQEAAEKGWRTADLFGVHREAGALRQDSTGCMVSLYPMTALAISAETITLGRRGTRSRARPITNPHESIPVWAFGKSA